MVVSVFIMYTIGCMPSLLCWTGLILFYHEFLLIRYELSGSTYNLHYFLCVPDIILSAFSTGPVIIKCATNMDKSWMNEPRYDTRFLIF
jgi:hypothetical protein